MLTSAKGRWGKRLLIALAVVGALVALVRLIADPLAVRYARKTFGHGDGVNVLFGAVHVSFFPPGARVKGLKVTETADRTGGAPLFYASSVTVTQRWSSLLRGGPLDRVVFVEPKLTLLPPSIRRNSPAELGQLLPKMPVRIALLEVSDGEVVITHGSGRDAAPIWIHDLEASVERKTATTGRHAELFTGKATGTVQKTGKLRVHLTLHPAADAPTFSLRTELRGLAIKDLYALATPQSGLQPSGGEVAMAADVECVQGRLSGTVKTQLENLKLRPTSGGLGNDIKAALAAAAVSARSAGGGDEQTLTTVVPVKGKLTDPMGELLTTLLDSIRASFMKGMKQGFEQRAPPAAP